jgi:hypothetical protein
MDQDKQIRINQHIKRLAEVDYKLILLKEQQDKLNQEIILKQTERLNILIKIESEKSCPF